MSALAALVLILGLLTGARHYVRPGETYTSVAADFGVSEDAVRRANPEVKSLTAGNVITVPELPAQQVWSPAHPYAPPLPTVAQLNREIRAGNVVLTENPEYSGYYFMWAGKGKNVEIGQIHPRQVEGKRVHDFHLLPETGGATESVALGTTTSFRRPAKILECTCVPDGL